MAKIKINGVEHHYHYIKNDSLDDTQPTLVFIHGWLLSHCYWMPLIKQLENQYSCLAYDLKGFGLSQQENLSLNNSHFTLKSYAEDLKTFLTALNIKQAWLIGHSLGGSIALWGADICPEIVTGVICINAGGGIYLQEEFESFRKAGENLVKFRPSWLLNLPFLDLLFARMMVKQPLALTWGKQRLTDFLQANEQAAIASLLESTTEEQVHLLPQIVARLRQPVYFIAGKQDKVMEVQYVKHLASFHPLFQQAQGNVEEIDNCGHFAMLEHTETVKECMIKMLNES